MTSPQELLKQNNPFTSSSVTTNEIWKPNYPDVESIHKDAFERMVYLVQEKQNFPNSSIALLVLGDGGMGKTQLLARTAKHCTQIGEMGCSLVNVPPFHGFDPMKHLLHTIFSGLYYEFDQRPDSPLFQKLLFGMLRERYPISENKIVEKIISNIFSYPKSKHGTPNNHIRAAIKNLQEEDPSFDKEFLQVLLQVWNKSRRSAAIRWMMGETLDRDEAKLLGFDPDPHTEEIKGITEEKGLKCLITFGKLLERYHQTLLICFDQLEAWVGTEQNLIQIIQTISSQCYGMMPITFAKPDIWYKSITQKLDNDLLDLLSTNTITLHGCNTEQVDDLIQVRIEHIFGDSWEAPYQWLVQKVRANKGLSSQPTPRSVIIAANRIISEKTSQPEEILWNQYDQLYNDIREGFERVGPDDDEILEALYIYFSAIGDKPTKKGNTISMSEAYIIVNTKTAHQSASSSFKRGNEYLAKHPDKACIYITDPRCEITNPTWSGIIQNKEEFKSRNGIIYVPNESEISRYYALCRLEVEVIQGNVCDEDNHELVRENLLQFVKNSDNFKPLLDLKRLYKERIIQAMLLQSPKHTQPIDTIMRECDVSLEFLQELCVSQPDMYSIDEMCFQMEEYWEKIATAIDEIIDEIGYTDINIHVVIGAFDARGYPVSEETLIKVCQVGPLQHKFAVYQTKDGYRITSP